MRAAPRVGSAWFRWLPLSVLGGLAQAAALADPFFGQPRWWLQSAAMLVLAWQLQAAPGWRAGALRGWAFATAWLVGTFWWLFISLHTYGGLPAPLAAVAVLGLAAFLALYFAAVCACFSALARSGIGFNALLFGAMWLLAELARAQWLTGFPWGAIGYAHIDGLLGGYAPWVGVYGIGALAAAGAMLLVGSLPWPVRAEGQAQHGLPQPRRFRPTAAVGVAVVVLLGGALAHHLGPPSVAGPAQSTGRLSVALLQGNIPQDEKFQPGSGVPLALAWYGEQLQASRAALVVAPETAIPLLPQQWPPGYAAALARAFDSPGGADGTAAPRAALLGLPRGNPADGFTNSVQVFAPVGTGAADYRYDKHHLVPFGEFIPPLFKWFTRMMNIPLGDFNRGGLAQPSLEWQGQRLAPNICYEDLFGEEIAAGFGDPARAPTVLVNMSNIGWFGNSIAIDQHLQISRMRTLEFARPMLRATNTGATAVIDHRGQVTHTLPRLTRAVLLAEVEGRTGTTPFAWWAGRFALWPMWAAALAVVAVAWLRRWRADRHSGS